MQMLFSYNNRVIYYATQEIHELCGIFLYASNYFGGRVGELEET